MDASTLKHSSTNPPHRVIVVGAGPIGVMAALGMYQQGWQVVLLEKESLDDQHPLPSSYDQRQLALTPQSVTWLVDELRLNSLTTQLTPILSIHTSSKGQFGSMRMQAHQQHVPALGYTIAQSQLGDLLLQALRQTSIQLYSGITLEQLQQDHYGVQLTATHKAQSLCLQADYLLAADGARSWVRQQLGIVSEERHYTHRLLTAVATLAEPHQHQAIERFTPSGPTALLPMTDPYQAKLVYCYDEQEVETVQRLATTELLVRINQQLGAPLPHIQTIDAISHYPLVEIRPKQIQQGRVMLIGNAAHTQHPIAGQGLNLGIRDVQAIVQWASSADTQYWFTLAQKRQQDHQRVMNATHGLVTVFTHHNPWVRRLASAGISFVDACTPLKKHLTRIAMGYTS